MAKKDRQKRSARKARQRARAEAEAARAASGNQPPQSESKSKVPFAKKDEASQKKPAKKKGGKPSVPSRVKGYFGDVRSELHQVVWPSRQELRSYSVAVIAMLIVFGVCVWLVDTGFVQGLVALTGLRG